MEATKSRLLERCGDEISKEKERRFFITEKYEFLQLNMTYDTV